MGSTAAGAVTEASGLGGHTTRGGAVDAGFADRDLEDMAWADRQGCVGLAAESPGGAGVPLSVRIW